MSDLTALEYFTAEHGQLHLNDAESQNKFDSLTLTIEVNLEGCALTRYVSVCVCVFTRARFACARIVSPRCPLPRACSAAASVLHYDPDAETQITPP